MEWIKGITEAIRYIEEHLMEDIAVEDIAREACISSFYFQKGFAMLCGFTVGEYIRQRRLALAGSELMATDAKIIDLAYQYGYDSPNSFTKAFTRFHGVTPNAVRRNGAMIKSFAPLKIHFSLEGGYMMDYRIEEKEAFTVLGVSKVFRYDDAAEEIPLFWTAHYQEGRGEVVCGMYGISIDLQMQSEEFEYLIADNYQPSKEIPDGFITKVIPKQTWAVFAAKGAMPHALQEVNKKVFSEWLPSCDYEIAAGYCVEMYTDVAEYAAGAQDENYYSEIWIPVKKK